MLPCFFPESLCLTWHCPGRATQDRSSALAEPLWSPALPHIDLANGSPQTNIYTTLCLICCGIWQMTHQAPSVPCIVCKRACDAINCIFLTSSALPDKLSVLVVDKELCPTSPGPRLPTPPHPSHPTLARCTPPHPTITAHDLGPPCPTQPYPNPPHSFLPRPLIAGLVPLQEVLS